MKFKRGLNYQSAEFGHQHELWENDKHLDIIDEDFKHMKKMGVEIVGIQSANFHKEEVLERILKVCRKHGVSLFPTLDWHSLLHLEGSEFKQQAEGLLSSGQMNDGDFFQDEALLRIQKKNMARILGKFKNEKIIFAWDLCGEPHWHAFYHWGSSYLKWYGLDQGKAFSVTNDWMKQLYRTAKEIDPYHPLTFGIDAGPLNLSVGINFFDVLDNVDFMATHSYSRTTEGILPLGQANSIMDVLMPSFVTRVSQIGGKKVLSGECGNTTSIMSEEKQGISYRIMLYSSLLNGADGIFPWCFHEYVEREELKRKYRVPSEFHFGIVRHDHTNKPAADEYASFMKFVQGLGEYEIVSSKKTAMFWPQGYYEKLEENRLCAFGAYAMLKSLNLSPDFLTIKQADRLLQYEFVVVPYSFLNIEEMDILKDFILHGGKVYFVVNDGRNGRMSYLEDLLGSELDDFEALSGRLNIGIRLPGKPVNNFTLDAGQFPMGLLKPEEWVHYRTYFQSGKARSIAFDEEGIPIVSEHETGAGKVFVSGLAIEALSLLNNNLLKNPLRRLYSYMIFGDMIKDDPWVERARLRTASGDCLVFLNISGTEKKVTAGKKTITLSPYGVKAIQDDKILEL